MAITTAIRVIINFFKPQLFSDYKLFCDKSNAVLHFFARKKDNKACENHFFALNPYFFYKKVVSLQNQ